MTSPKRWEEIDQIFAAALERDPDQRHKFVAEECGEDDELRREVESLLAHDSPESLLGSSAVEEATRLLTNTQARALENKTLGPYRIVRLLGVGGMGEVYLAHDTRLNRSVAIKVLSWYAAAEQERIRRFRQEALAASALNHPNIITIYEIGAFEEHNFIVSEFVDGQTLLNIIKTGELSIQQAIDFAIQIASALAAAHSAKIIHRDIKPANVMVRADGLVKVLDFGIAKYTETHKGTDHETELQTSPGTVMGTAAYMSPEQARGLLIDARTDIWSLGVMLYEMVTGKRPFSGDTPLDVMSAVIGTDPPSFKEVGQVVPAQLQQIVQRALHKQPDARYQSAQEVVNDLKQLQKVLDSGEHQSGLADVTPTSSTSRSIAVLPFINMSADHENEYFCDGLSEELLNALTKIEDLKVAARTSSFQFKGKNTSVSEIGRALNVKSVLEGSVRKSGDRLRITLQLINAENGYHLWSEKYDRQMKDIFDIQDEIALSVVNALKLKLIGDEKAAVLKRYTQSVEAYEFYLRGRYYWWKTAPQEFLKGKEYFERALEVDPSYALSYGGLSSYYGYGSAFGMLPPDVGWPKAIAANARALALDNTLPELHTNEGGINMVYRRDFAAAEQHIERSMELNPKFQEAHYIYSSFLITRGRFDEAITQARTAVDLDPFLPRLLNNLGFTYYVARRFPQAVSAFKQAVELDPHNPLLHDTLGDALLLVGRPDEAVEEWSAGFECIGNTAAAAKLSQTFADSGVDDTLTVLARLKLDDLNTRRNRGEYVPEIHFVRALTAAGETEEAISRFRKACEERHVFPLFIHADPFYDRLRQDQRVRDVLQRSGLTPTAT
jgi:serine/threonine protein kinase